MFIGYQTFFGISIFTWINQVKNEPVCGKTQKSRTIPQLGIFCIVQFQKNIITQKYPLEHIQNSL